MERCPWSGVPCALSQVSMEKGTLPAALGTGWAAAGKETPSCAQLPSWRNASWPMHTGATPHPRWQRGPRRGPQRPGRPHREPSSALSDLETRSKLVFK